MLISSAHAQGAAAPATGFDFNFILLIGAMFVMMYFMIIRPNQKRMREQKAMLDALQKGDEVVAAGGMLGKIVKINENYATLEIATDTEIVVQRSTILNLLPKGTIKSL